MFRLLMLLVALLLTPMAYAQVDINSAAASELQSLPGIGPSKAEAIIDYRSQNGPFKSVDDLDDVSGIGPATVENLRALVAVGKGAAPTKAKAASAPSTSARVNVNSADASGLETLPGIGPTKARAILDDRETNGPYASCDDLARVNGIGTATLSGIRDLCKVK